MLKSLTPFSFQFFNYEVNDYEAKLVLKPLGTERKWRFMYRPIHGDIQLLSKKIPITKYLNLQVFAQILPPLIMAFQWYLFNFKRYSNMNVYIQKSGVHYTIVQLQIVSPFSQFCLCRLTWFPFQNGTGLCIYTRGVVMWIIIAKELHLVSEIFGDYKFTMDQLVCKLLLSV